MKSTDTGYGTIAVVFHWATAVLVVILLVSGFRSGFAEDTAEKAAALRVHVPVALAVMFLTVGRLIWWWRFDRKPASLPGTPALQAVVARWTHRALYLLLGLLLASGVAMSAISGLPDALYGTADFPELSSLPPRTGHGIGARLIVVLLALHTGAALYHHLVIKDRTLRRMWFGAQW